MCFQVTDGKESLVFVLTFLLVYEGLTHIIHNLHHQMSNVPMIKMAVFIHPYDPTEDNST